MEIQPPQPEPSKVSFRCWLYGNEPHTPCAGTLDDETEGNCECWCHKQENPEQHE